MLGIAVVAARLFRSLCRTTEVEQARSRFRREREWLETGFLDALSRLDAVERLRWEEAHWGDEVIWARDRQNGRLHALVGVEFDPDPFDEYPDHPARHATVLFEFHRGRWRADGRRLDEVRPNEAVLRNRRFEPFIVPQRPV